MRSFPPINKEFLNCFRRTIALFPDSEVPILRSSVKASHSVRRAAVLVPLCNVNGVPSVVFTVRTHNVGTHKGQVSFPGGHIENGEQVVDAAIRELSEELFSKSVDGNKDCISNRVEIIGSCQTIPAITKTLVTPIIGFIKPENVDLKEFSPNPQEVDHIFARSFEELSLNKRIEEYNRNGVDMKMPVWGDSDSPEKIWGLTALILDAVMQKAIIPTYKTLLSKC
jgi:nudix motif 8